MSRPRIRNVAPRPSHSPVSVRFAAVLGLSLVVLLPVGAVSQSTVNVDDEKVGIGTPTPVDKVHIYGADSGAADTVRLRIENDADTTRNRRIVELRNNGPVTVRYNNTSASGITWNLNALPGGFAFSVAGSGVNELLLEPNGNLVIQGTLTQGSSREWKRDFSEVESREILDRVDELEIQTWRYDRESAGELHLGPMAEDFHRAFGLGGDDQHLAPADAAGVALAAIQGLYEIVREKDEEIERLRSRLDRLEASAAPQPAVPASSR